MLPTVSVAVAVKKLSVVATAGKLTLKVAFPLAFVLTSVDPMKFFPSPFPDPSQVSLEKKSSRNDDEAVLLSEPHRKSWLLATAARLITGKFWSSFGSPGAVPSRSPASLAVIPSFFRSMPKPALPKMELRLMALRMPNATTTPVAL